MREIIGSIAILFLTTTNIFSQDTFTIKVSCTIPEVPGLNAPLLKEESESQSINKQEAKSREEIDSPKQEIIQKVEEEINLKIITLYSR